ncbi:arylsulfatase B-like [Spodoptera litura]|uniref:Arylsulfatase B-like n=1 Tax=Spodoptera litura TaxID=69820 RepID=A0A9J7E793_SPOLT|nr:arylsulfatase B-like [Spodoptera litura]
MRLIFYVLSLVVLIQCESLSKPNIVFIVADDLGWSDVSFHGSDQIMTPNIDVLAYQGIIIPQYYTDTRGTPARSALFTGKYPLRMGTQGISIASAEDRGLPTTEALLPQYLQELGYSTHLIGKWGLGKSREHYLPTNRGFDTFYGFSGSSVDYYTYNHVETWNDTVFYGLDLFNNLEPVEDQRGHLTEVLTERAVKLIRNHDPSVPLYLHISHAAPHVGGGFVNLQTPEDLIAANDHIAHSPRRLYAGLVTGLDRSIGHVISALAERELLNNTIVVLISDNGAASTGLNRNFGSNLPLRGTKGTPWEGAVRTTAVIWHAAIPSKIWPGLFHVTDWMPTLIAAAGGEYNGTIDGINQWNALTTNDTSLRQDVLITTDDLKEYAAFREGNYKIIIGKVEPQESEYYGMELKKSRLPGFLYENVLLSSDTARVFRETLFINIDLEMAATKRNYSDLYRNINNTDAERLCIPTNAKGCLFDLSVDPAESNDLWHTHPQFVQHMVLRLRAYWAAINPRHEPTPDPRANPALHDFIWLPWLDNLENVSKPLLAFPNFPLQVSVGELQYLVDFNLNAFKESLTSYVKSSADAFIQNIAKLFSF